MFILLSVEVNEWVYLFIYKWKLSVYRSVLKTPSLLVETCFECNVINPFVQFLLVVHMGDIETQVLEWLKAGNDTAEDIVDLPWSIRRIGSGMYAAEHPRMPFSLLVTFSEDFIHLLVPLGLETFPMTKDEKLRVYHTLLRLNDQVNLMKFTLSGMDDDVYLRVDLDKKTLGKAEFNDALTALLIGLMSAVSALGLEEAFAKELFDRIVGMVLERVERGASRDELMKFLTVKVGMSVEDAKNLLDEVFAAKKEVEEQGKDVGYF